MKILSDANVTHVSYILLLYSVAFILFLCKSLRSRCSQTPSHAANLQLSIFFSTFMASMPGPSRPSSANRGTPRCHRVLLVQGQTIHVPFRP
jgi:hypothetical protein